MIPALDFLIIALATFRLIHLLAYDPLGLRLREYFIEYPETQDSKWAPPQPRPKGSGLRHFIGKQLLCYWCLGIYLSPLMVAFYYYGPQPVTSFILLCLAIAGVAGLLEKWTQSTL